MRRLIDDMLLEWKDSAIRQPLLLRGARQVGKTYSVSRFGEANFENVVSVNFEEKPELSKCFSDFNPREIINRISILTREPIYPGRTLLFLDEIQEFPRVLTAMRYFYEKMPDLHLIGAGSLIEFTLRSEDFRMPVGRIQSMHMFPMSFQEFLIALGENRLCDYLQEVRLETGIEKVFAVRLEHLLRQYLLVGGMPGVVDAYIRQVAMTDIQRLQNGLIRTYADDFAKYASTAKHKYLREVYSSTPKMVGQRFKYARINPDIQSKFLKEALELLCDARCLIKIYHSSGAGTPLGAKINERKFKVAFLDVGLMQNALGVRSSIVLDEPVLQIHAGSVAEQFVAQELMAGNDPYTAKPLFFWAREARSSNAEIDYLIEKSGLPIPVEVKAGATGSLKSMRIFMEEYPHTPLGVRYAMHDLSYHDRILSIPLYMVNQTSRLIGSLIGR